MNGDLSFSSINSYEVDYGNFTSFTDTAPAPLDVSSGSLLGIGWGGFLAGVPGANSSTTYTISYTVNATNAAEAITRLAQLYVVDANVGPGASATATEQAFDSAGNLVGTTTWSAATGASSSVTLAAGYQQLNIVLTVNESIGSAGLPASAVSLSVIDQYFGQTLVSQLASINSTVFCDANENGAQDSGETGMAGVIVELLNSTGTQILGTTTTNASGGYSFSNLQVGTYETQVIAPSGDLITTANGGLDAGIALKAGQNDTVAPTGLYMPAVFDVHVYLDANDNGVQDSGDSNLSGVAVALLNGNGSPTGETATTDANGNVSFAGLAAGSYEVSVTTPSGDIVTQDTNVMTPVTLASCDAANAIEGLYPATPDVLDCEVGDFGWRRLRRPRGDLCRRGNRLQRRGHQHRQRNADQCGGDGSDARHHARHAGQPGAGRYRNLHRVADSHASRTRQRQCGNQHRDGERRSNAVGVVHG